MDISGAFKWVDFGAGWFSGICGLVVGHPADTVKVQQQTVGNRSALTVILTIIKYEGPSALYKGLMMPLFSAGLINSVFFGCYGNALRVTALNRGETPLKTCCDTDTVYRGFHWDIFNAGCIAGAITTFVACPFEVVKIKLQSQADHLVKCKGKHAPPKYTGTFDCLIKLWKEGGFKYVYKGLVPMLWRDVPSYGFFTLVYEHILCVCGKQLQFSPAMCVVLGGSAAGVASWVPLTPIDVIKSRIQADNPRNPQFRNMKDCIRQTYREYGLPFFARGLFVTIARAIPVNAATFTGYEFFLYVHSRLSEDEDIRYENEDEEIITQTDDN